MYKISVPVVLDRIDTYGREEYRLELQRVGAERIFFVIDQLPDGAEEEERLLAALKNHAAYFKENGFETGAWYWALLSHSPRYTRIRGFLGRDSVSENCPADPEFLRSHAEFIKKVAKTGVDLIMFDDDLRFGFHDSGFGCLCRHHLAAMEALLGEPVPEEGLYRKIFAGGPNRYRDAWYTVTGETLRNFARTMRDAVDSVSPGVRVGACSCMTVWDTDGVDSYTLARDFAGGTVPFVRLIGAPYWAVNRNWGNRLQDVIELERMQLAWRGDENTDIEVFSEGDVFPRPRFRVPAAYLEGFDTALRASGGFDGILKYMMDYRSGPSYETGYSDRHVRNAGLYREIEARFGGKTAVGVRIYEAMQKLRQAEFTEKETENLSRIQDMFFSRAARMLACHAIPTVYEGRGVCGAAFGENARYLPEDALQNGLLLDIRAAEYLCREGIDVGISDFGEAQPVFGEYFPQERTLVKAEGLAYRVVAAPGAEILSYFNQDPAFPSAIRYENADGQRFCVLPVDAYTVDYDVAETYYRSYARGRQLRGAIEWLGKGNGLPAEIDGNPDLYMLCRKGDGALTVGLWNFCIDEVAEGAEIRLSGAAGTVRSVRFFGKAEGTLEGNTIRLSKPIPPFGFAGLEVLC